MEPIQHNNNIHYKPLKINTNIKPYIKYILPRIERHITYKYNKK